MEVQKFRIKRINPDIHWEIPCSGGTNFWPINTSTNCSGVTMYNTTGIEVMAAINGDTLNSFPEELKHCSPTDPCIILWNTGPNNSPNHCTSVDGFLYTLFKGLNVTYLGNTYSDSFNQIKSVISVANTSTSPINITPNTFGCQCLDQLGENVSKLSLFLTQDFNDIGHYSVWDGNISQQEVFANFTFSGVSSGGMGILVSNSTDFGYYAELQESPYTIDWGEGLPTSVVQLMYFPFLTTQDIYTYTTPGQYKITITQDSPWGPLSTEKIITVPLETYPVMAGSPISMTNLTLQMDQASPLTGPPVYDILGNVVGFSGSSTGYFNDYPNMPLDSATHINQYSGMSFGPGSQGGQPCYTISGVTDSILGNFQTYTSINSPNLPPGFNQGVVVPIGGDVVDPITNGFLTGVYGVITSATTVYTAYTISSAANSTGTAADGDTPINFWDFTNGITIFEATSCGLDNLAWGAEECIACPSGDCEYCTTKDEYVDRGNIPGIMGTSIQIGPGTVIGDWSPSGNYVIGDIVYDVTFNSCCCYMAVIDITSTDPWFGTAPVMMNEGAYEDNDPTSPTYGVKTHVWEACSPECVSCPPGTNTPCNDFTLGPPNVYSLGNTYNIGDFVQGPEGNCYQAISFGALSPPTGYTMQYSTEWDYIGCVSWICPVEGPVGDCDSDCIGVNNILGIWQMNNSSWGWAGGAWLSSFNNYSENDTITYNGVCYVCLSDNVGPDFPCSMWSTYGTPDISSHWQACPLPSSTSLDCIMISGATLDTFDQFGNPITVTGEMFWGDCDTNLNDGTCFDVRYKCIDPYTCQGCTPILSDDPLYFSPLSFATEPECIVFCEPDAFSCSTPTAVGVPCCEMISCQLDSTLYVNIMTSVNAVGSTFSDLSYNHSLFLTPPYEIGDCNNGVLANTLSDPTIPFFPVPPVNLAPNGAIPECCITVVWSWDCENGCQSMGGLPTPGTLVIGSEVPDQTLWPSQNDCEQNMLIYFGVTNVVGDVPCSWWCEDPYVVYNPPTPGPYQSPCIPWYTLGSPPTPMPGPFQSEPQCLTACTAVVECWVCDCNQQPSPCISSYPNQCPTLLSTNPNTYGPDPGGGLNGIPSFATMQDCMDNCICDFGWDCFLETGTTTTPTIPPVNVGCNQGISQATIASMNWQVSDPTPGFTGYTSFSACCYANEGCCYANCDDDPGSAFNTSTYTPPGYPTPLGDWPCSYLPTYSPSSPCNDPTAPGYVYIASLPWCFMFDCTNSLCPPNVPPTGPGNTCCGPENTTCDCACGPEPVNSKGPWDSLYQSYEEDDAVYWGDTDTDFCCFRCNCPIIIPATAPTPGDASTYDCNHFTPGDPPAGSVPNCWESCDLTPGDAGSGSGSGSGSGAGAGIFIWQGTPYNPCSGCTPTAYYDGYSCTPDGCQLTGCNPGMGTGPLFNCYTSSNCDDGNGPECVAQCFCIPGTDPCIPMCATYQQELILASGPIPTDCPPNIYAYNSYNECMGINPVNSSLPNCCPAVLPPQWYCDDSSNCNGNISQTPGVDGVGCVEVNDGDTLYQNPLTTNFTSLADCQGECKWCCDPNGVTTCTFVGPAFNCSGSLYISALDCHLATTTNTPCDCSVPATEWWCHYDYSSGMGGCVSNISGLADLDLFGVGQVTRDANSLAYFTSLGNCQEVCKFCCDCNSNTASPGTCYLNWNCAQLSQCSCLPGGCYDTLPNCITNEEPCIEIDPDIYCDDILGCIPYPVINTLMSGPYTGPFAQTDCEGQCQFECNNECACEFTAVPVNPLPSSPPPCYTLACCLAATNNNQRCCECEKCETSSPHPYIVDVGGVAVTYWHTVTFAQLSTVVNWNPVGPFANGDIVTQDGCCYIMVLTTDDWILFDTTMLPSDYYNQYINVLNTTGLPQYGIDLMWLPCDPECPPVTYEERWWCDDNNPQYPYQITNCIQEYPYIDDEITANVSYGDNVWGTDAGAWGSQVSYNQGGSPFSSLEDCQTWCKFCCEPPEVDDCCCCKPDGFGDCVLNSETMVMNPTNIPCDQLCGTWATGGITCPDVCCCCKEDLINGGCLPTSQQSWPNPTYLPCQMLCNNNGRIPCEVDGSGQGTCKICCKDAEVLGTQYYIIQGPVPPGCECYPGDSQVPLGFCDVIVNDDGETPAEAPEGLIIHQRGEVYPGGPGGGPDPAPELPGGLTPATNAGPQPCCIICQTPGGSQYQVNGFTIPGCKCLNMLDFITNQKCKPPSPASQPCFLDWGCQICSNDCYNSWYSCMTLTNDCSPGDCEHCIGHFATYYWRQGGLYGYWNPIQYIANSVANTFNGWDGTNAIPHSTPQIWTTSEPYWGAGQVVIDPKMPNCCFVRTQLFDAGQYVPNMLPDAYAPSEHWCNFLSGNSADGLNLYTMGPSPNVTTWQDSQGNGRPWWVPCDVKCPPCGTGGTAPWGWKCIDGHIGGCVIGQYAFGDPHVFANQQDCDDKCQSYLCNSNPYWWAETKCSNANHNNVVGNLDDFVNWFINHANDALTSASYVYTDNSGVWSSPPGCTHCAPCPIPPPSGVGTGGMASTQAAMFRAHHVNAVPPQPGGYTNPNGGSSTCEWSVMQNGPSSFSTGGYSWADNKNFLLTNYGTELTGAISVAQVQDVMANIGCQWIWDAAEFTACQTHCGGACSGPQLATSTLYNHSGMYTHPTTNTTNRWQAAGQSMHTAGNIGCGWQVNTSGRPCHCSIGNVSCDCWLLPGTGTTGGPANVWDFAYHIDEYVDCTTSCCSGSTCACCEPDLTAAGLITQGAMLDWQPTGAQQWYTDRVTGAYNINECFTFPHDWGPGSGGSIIGDLSGIWSWGAGTLSGGCCVCCVAGGPGGNSTNNNGDPLNDGILADCYWETTTTSVYPANDPNYAGNPHWGFGPSPPNPLPYPDINGNPAVIDVQFYDYIGQWVACGVKEDCTSCGTPLTPL
jgi:hypothetical protein